MESWVDADWIAVERRHCIRVCYPGSCHLRRPRGSMRGINMPQPWKSGVTIEQGWLRIATVSSAKLPLGCSRKNCHTPDSPHLFGRLEPDIATDRGLERLMTRGGDKAAAVFVSTQSINASNTLHSSFFEEFVFRCTSFFEEFTFHCTSHQI